MFQPNTLLEAMFSSLLPCWRPFVPFSGFTEGHVFQFHTLLEETLFQPPSLLEAICSILLPCWRPCLRRCDESGWSPAGRDTSPAPPGSLWPAAHSSHLPSMDGLNVIDCHNSFASNKFQERFCSILKHFETLISFLGFFCRTPRTIFDKIFSAQITIIP